MHHNCCLHPQVEADWRGFVEDFEEAQDLEVSW